MDQLVKADAREFGLHVKQGGWRLGLLVARNVKKGVGQGARLHRDHDEVAKVSASEFARAAGTTADRVLRYLNAWEKAADARVVAHADELVPGQEVRGLNVEKLPPWEDYFDASGAGGRPRDAKPEDAAKILARATPEVRAQIIAPVLDPKTAKAMQDTEEGIEATTTLSDAETDRMRREHTEQAREDAERKGQGQKFQQRLHDSAELREENYRYQQRRSVESALNKLVVVVVRLQDGINEGFLAGLFTAEERESMIQQARGAAEKLEAWADAVEEIEGVPDAVPADWQ